MLNVLSNELDFLTSVDGFESFILTRRYHEPGEFELHVNRHMFGADQLQKNNLVALNPKRAGIIKHKELPLDESGKASENWKIKGPTLEGIFNQRITIPPDGIAYDYKSGQAETVMKHYANRNAITPDDRNRKFIMLRDDPDFGRGAHVNWQSRYKVLGEELRDISLASGLGWGVFLDTRNKWMIFDCYEGSDKSTMTGNFPPVAFSVDNDTIISQNVTDSDLNMRNVGYIGGAGEGELREILELGTATGINRQETFVDARDVGGESSNGETLQERGERKLSELETEFYYEAQIQTPISKEIYSYIHESFLSPYQPTGELKRTTEQISPFVYGKDFDLGDIVRIVDKRLGIQRSARITEIKEIYERGTGFRIEATFGYSRPTVFDVIKRKFEQFEGELKR